MPRNRYAPKPYYQRVDEVVLSKFQESTFATLDALSGRSLYKLYSKVRKHVCRAVAHCARTYPKDLGWHSFAYADFTLTGAQVRTAYAKPFFSVVSYNCLEIELSGAVRLMSLQRFLRTPVERLSAALAKCCCLVNTNLSASNMQKTVNLCLTLLAGESI